MIEMVKEICPIHNEIKVYVYTKRSSKIPNQKVDIGKQCETCLVGVINSMNATIPKDLVPRYPYQKEYLKGLDL